ncbi:MAG: alpha/beta fold hydrolase [Phycisphaera sp.]|nr:alpha/beta fold hydrolase [Phycisphaera sp.]
MRNLPERGLIVGLMLSLLMVGTLRAEDGPRIDADVVYGHKDGMALTFDVIHPAAPNGSGVLYMVSGGWYSGWTPPRNMVGMARPMLDAGITVFIVRHGSAPRYTVPEAIDDVRRAVRVVHMRAKEYGVDADRLGVTGGSAGGHLTCMLATTGDDGAPDAKDEVLRFPSRIAAAVALFPPTDLRGWTTNPPEVIGKIPALKPPLSFDAAKEADCSPLLHVSATTAPTLLIHGDKDPLVPLEHSNNLLAALKAAKVDCKLIVVEGAGHGFNAEQNKETVGPALLDWFVAHLAAKEAK